MMNTLFCVDFSNDMARCLYQVFTIDCTYYMNHEYYWLLYIIYCKLIFNVLNLFKNL